MLSVAETAVERRFSVTLASLRQASLYLFNPQSADVSERCIPDALAKFPQEVPAAQASDPRQREAVGDLVRHIRAVWPLITFLQHGSSGRVIRSRGARDTTRMDRPLLMLSAALD